ncbi:MAG: indole-3-glycerol-phosphate synthase [Candidatus Bathyarchaeota archaeon]|uniref:indole-3-glycerol-phosphate synthase n=1 Tax=Candidatus Bathycorpusculum sp. TaxID=2994959 RepID=UPI00281807A1|nr:indole-3-glycerol-phosphate synthase [Candidatus Termiticorpusculum sp.]MCL2257070.1 indole-3-glycerol-phosphate synthase [Candidatus Termiticorpusculum sp.]MCL2292778.1 indole-3-glycerol-phosphate synthase [Candidatus Termiticorpusculum sp.]
MSDFYDTLGYDARATINSGYYSSFKLMPSLHLSLKKAILKCNKNSIISEVKFASPAFGVIRENKDLIAIVQAMERGGAVAISVLTEPCHFNGSINTLVSVRGAVNLPLLMKDIILSPIQIAAAVNIGADAVLLIKTLYDRGYGEVDLDNMIEIAHAKGLEVLLEVHTGKEFKAAKKTKADIIGINNRNLADLKINLNNTKKILQTNSFDNLVIVSESGICTVADLLFLNHIGVSAFLIGSSIMLTENIEKKVREFVNA